MRNFTLPQLALPEQVTRVVGNYWNPTPEFVEELAQFLKGRKVLEIFAGNGYLAGLLHARGIDVVATTLFAGHDCHERGLYFPVKKMDAAVAVLEHGDNRDVLLVSWPTVTHTVLSAALLWGFNKDIVFIGEVTDYSKKHLGGCATDEFFENMEFTRKFETYQGNWIESALVGRLKQVR